MKKKTLVLILSALLAVGSFAACGTGGSTASSASVASTAPAESSAAPTESSAASAESAAAAPDSETASGTITFLSWNDENRSAPMLETFSALYPDVSIDFQYAPPVKDYIEKLSTLLYSGSAPDIFQMALENREDLMKGNYCLDLSDRPYMQDGTIPDVSINNWSLDGKVYSLSVDGWVGGLFYNKRMFTEAGIEAEPQSWDELLDACKKLKDAGFAPLMDNCQDAAATILPALVGAQTIQKNPDFTSKVYAGELTFADGWTEPMEMWYQLVENGYLDKNMVGITPEQMVTEFATETVAMIPTGPWNIGTIKDINPDLDFECMGIPGKDEGNIWYTGAVNVGLSVNAASDNKELALLFIDYAATPEGLKAQYESYGSTIIAKGYSPEANPIMSDAEEGFRNSKTYIPMGDWVSYSEPLRNTYLTSLQDCLVGNIAPANLAANLDTKLQEMLAG